MLTLLLAACTSPVAPSDEPPPRALAARPRIVPTTSPTSTSSVAGPPSTPAPQDEPPATSAPPQAPAFTPVLTIEDARGDAGLQARGYADLASVRIDSNGVNARIVVRVRSGVPERLADGEVIGLGIDLYHDADATESDHQVFAEGGVDGWFAWRQTPRGFEEYQGTFTLDGTRLVFEVPWAAIGGAGGEVSVFLDWSEARPVLNAAGSDRAPDRGRAQLRSS